MSSIPHESLIKLSSIPSFFLSSIGTEPWVIKEGTSERDSTPPKLSARIKHLRFWENFLAFSMSPRCKKNLWCRKLSSLRSLSTGDRRFHARDEISVRDKWLFRQVGVDLSIGHKPWHFCNGPPPWFSKFWWTLSPNSIRKEKALHPCFSHWNKACHSVPKVISLPSS